MKINNPKSICLLMALFFCLCGKGQEKIKDTLYNKNYDELKTLFYTWLPKDTLVAEAIANVYIEKGRWDKDSLRMAKGYYLCTTSFGPEKGLQYADTIISLTKDSNDKFYPAVGYLVKGYWLYQLDDYKESLKYYLIGNNYAIERNNFKQQVHTRPMIIALKDRAGDHKGALSTAQEHLYALKNQPGYIGLYEGNPDYRNLYEAYHLGALYSLSLLFLQVKDKDSSRIYFRKGIAKSLEYRDTIQYYELVSSSGSLEYYDGNFQAALDSLNKAIRHLTDEHNITMAYYYKGKSYEALDKDSEALTMFLKTDSLAEKINYKFPELRQAYEYLIDRYTTEQDRDSQLVYINKVMDLDKELRAMSSMDVEIVRKYDTPQLIHRKELLIDGLEQKDKRNTFYKWLLLAAVVLLSIVLIYNYRKRKTYQKRYRELLSQNNKGTDTMPEVSSQEREIPECRMIYLRRLKKA